MDRHADGLTAEYTKKAREVDHTYGDVPRPPPGPPGAPQLPRVVGRVERQLQSFGEVRGWCFGVWGEASQECHAWVQKIATASVEAAYMQPGRQGQQRRLCPPLPVLHRGPAAGPPPG